MFKADTHLTKVTVSHTRTTLMDIHLLDLSRVS